MNTSAPVPSVLVVDDEEPVRRVTERALRSGGYEVALAPDGPTALTLVERAGPFDLYVIDLLMPRMNGKELARQLRTADPTVKVLFFTGYGDQLFDTTSLLGDNEAFVEKPVAVKGLLEAVSLLLFGHCRGPANRERSIDTPAWAGGDAEGAGGL